MQKILITGGAGYIGTSLTTLALKKGFKVIALDNLKHSKTQFIKQFIKNKHYTFFKCDINDLNKFEKILKKEKVNIIVHLAGIVGDPASKLQKKLTKLTNVVSSKKIFLLSEKYNVDKFIFSSTCSNYGIVNSKLLANENSKLKPLSLYAKTKVDFENFMIEQSKKIKMHLVIMRFATVFGVSDRMRFDLTINQFTRDLYFNKKLNIFGQNTWRPYCHVKDVSRAIIYSIDSIRKINIFNVGNSKQNYSKKIVLDAIGKFIPLKNLTYSKQEISDKRDYKVNFTKINKQLKFKTKYNLNFGIKEVIVFLKRKRKDNLYSKIYSNT